MPTYDNLGKEGGGFYFAYADPLGRLPASFIKDNRSQKELRYAITGHYMIRAQSAEGNA